ncbi:hypothetical protein RclHR1_01390016 [Rhizophagus clarus]|uniref:F-box domain-containing protein n=1 Tax=Rhizophagus clarus TaxID=94130 RepID=A0A2Z6R3S4_9GLOM|nr:hypothetical protein RclHR1_01390016 [Rhizophagus clarus]GET04897.1 hypothetical protein GLOIN_2v1764020 [Rhizophagus clarus]
MSRLNEDILFLIFGELQNDSRSLFSCLMINKLWCETAIPILWRNPWCYSGIDYNNKDYLFKIIAYYLSDDVKESLKSQGIQLPLISHQSLLFDYLSFCKSINVNVINSIAFIGSFIACDQFLLQQEFYSLFMRKCSELKYLDMKSIKHQIFHFPEAKLRFETLCELKCDTSVDSSYFYGLAYISQYIQRITIDNCIDKEANLGIVKLIEAQKNLKYFELKDYFYGDSFIIDPYKEIFLALEKKADIINHLKLYITHDGCTLQKVLPKFHKLKTLIINDFSYFNEQQLKMSIYRDLEIFKTNHYNLKAITTIINNSGARLKKILINICDDSDNENFNEDSLILIRRIHENCPLIEGLCIVFSSSKNHFVELEKLLKVCRNLKSLLLDIVDLDYEIEGKFLENGEELLKTLIRSAPTNLREIGFFYDISFSLKVLEEFLQKWKGHAISIFTNDLIYENEDYLKVIDKYKNNGVIRDFKYVSLMHILNRNL